MTAATYAEAKAIEFTEGVRCACPIGSRAFNPWPSNTPQFFKWEDQRALFLNGRVWGCQRALARASTR